MVDTLDLKFDSGVEVRLSRPNQMLLSKVRREFLKNDPEPKVPQVWIEDNGRNEPNPNDPIYIAELTMWKERITFIAIEVVLATAVQITKTPEGMMTDDSDEFNALLKMGGLPIPETDVERKVAWLNAVGMSSEDDLVLLQTKTFEIVGATEEQVAAAEAMFRGQEAQPAD